jgi:hypothetical protein
MAKQNPFPGMNPFFEQQWRDAHTMLIAYLRDALHERLPEDLVVRVEAEVVALGTGKRPIHYRPDVQVRELEALKEPGAVAIAPPPPTAANEPIRVLLEEEIERWLEIHEATGPVDYRARVAQSIQQTRFRGARALSPKNAKLYQWRRQPGGNRLGPAR